MSDSQHLVDRIRQLENLVADLQHQLEAERRHTDRIVKTRAALEPRFRQILGVAS